MLDATVTDVSFEVTDTDLPPPPERGTTTISPRVFERLAARAAAEVAGVEGLVQTGVDRFLPWADGSPAEATAAAVDDDDSDDDGVVLDLTFNVLYPQPVRQVAEQVRQHVSDRVGSLTGRRVGEINITVAALVVPQRRSPRVR